MAALENLTMNDSTGAAVTWATVAAQRAILAGELDRLRQTSGTNPHCARAGKSAMSSLT